MILKKYLSSIIAFVVLFLVAQTKLSFLLHPQVWLIFGFFFSLDFLIKILVEQGMANKRENFIQFYLSTIVLRFILLLIFIAFGLYQYPEQKNLFVGNVFVLYLFFTFFEISVILRKLRRF
jgi:hypothetical protein